MPMPTGGAWPPVNVAPAYDMYRDWDAWYIGDPDALFRAYQRRAHTGLDVPPSQRVRPSQFAGGVMGVVSRWLWGAPPPVSTRDSRLHIPLPSDLAATAAGLLLSDSPTITAEAPEAQARIEELMAGGLIKALRQAAEAGSALGDVYLRPVVDTVVSPTAAICTAVHADQAIPVFRWGHLVEVTFWSELAGNDRQVIYRLLEHHDVVEGRGRITYRLFKGKERELGRSVPLAEHPDAAEFAQLPEGVQLTGLSRLDVVHVPNAGPQRLWRKQANLKYFGRSDFDGNEQIFDRLDAAWTSWMQDLWIARGRITVPEYMLQNLGNGQGAGFDAERAIYVGLNMMPNQPGQGAGITATQFEIRHEAHRATTDALLEVAMRHSGLSAQTMGEEGDVAMTATEAGARERLSYITRGDRIAAWGPGVAAYVELHMEVEQIHGMSRVEPVRPTVEFSDGVSESPKQVAETIQLLRAAEVISIETGVRMAHPDWEDPQVSEEVDKIKKDRATSGDDPGAALAGYARGDNEGGDPTEE